MTDDRPQPGDRVMCIEGNAYQLTRGATYTVREVWDTAGATLVGLNIWPGQLFGWWRFKKVTA